MRGLEIAKTIGLQLKQCKRNSQKLNCGCSLQSVGELIKSTMQTANGLIIIWQIHKITWGKLNNGQLSALEELQPENWLEFRIFNEDEEIHMKRAGNIFRGRYVRDEVGQDDYYVDSFARFWGDEEENSADDGYIHLLDEQRKLYMEIPCDEAGFTWYGLLTRNYIESDETTGLSGYVDYRFVAIEPAKEGAGIG